MNVIDDGMRCADPAASDPHDLHGLWTGCAAAGRCHRAGAGASARHRDRRWFGGMLGGTFLGIFFIPAVLRAGAAHFSRRGRAHTRPAPEQATSGTAARRWSGPIAAKNAWSDDAAAWAGVLSACTLEPHYHQPVLPVSDRLAVAGASAPLPPSTPAPVMHQPWEIGWREFFVDRQLSRSLRLRWRIIAICASRCSTSSWRARSIRSSASNLMPQIDANASYKPGKLPPALILGQGGSIRREPAFPLQTIYQVGLGVTPGRSICLAKCAAHTHARFQQ